MEDVQIWLLLFSVRTRWTLLRLSQFSGTTHSNKRAIAPTLIPSVLSCARSWCWQLDIELKTNTFTWLSAFELISVIQIKLTHGSVRACAPWTELTVQPNTFVRSRGNKQCDVVNDQPSRRTGNSVGADVLLFIIIHERVSYGKPFRGWHEICPKELVLCKL
jgi:hypothetical protein